MDHAAFNPTYLELQQFAFASDNTSNVRTPAPKSSPLKAPQHDEARSFQKPPCLDLSRIPRVETELAPMPHLDGRGWDQYRTTLAASSPGTPFLDAHSYYGFDTPSLTYSSSTGDSSRRESTVSNQSYRSLSGTPDDSFFAPGEAHRRFLRYDAHSAAGPGLGLHMDTADAQTAFASVARMGLDRPFEVQGGQDTRKRQFSDDVAGGYGASVARAIPGLSTTSPKKHSLSQPTPVINLFGSEDAGDYFGGLHRAPFLDCGPLLTGSVFEQYMAGTGERRYAALPSRATSLDYSHQAPVSAPPYPTTSSHWSPIFPDFGVDAQLPVTGYAPTLQHRHSFAHAPPVHVPNPKRARRTPSANSLPFPGVTYEAPVHEVLPKRRAAMQRAPIDLPASESSDSIGTNDNHNDSEYNPESDPADRDYSGPVAAAGRSQSRRTSAVAQGSAALPTPSLAIPVSARAGSAAPDPAWISRRPPQMDFEMDVEDPDAIPHVQKIRFADDMYTPRWIRGAGAAKEGWCALCDSGKWLQLKNSAFWYHKQYTHGVSSTSGYHFLPPLETKELKDGSIEGLCHGCQKWHKYKPKKNGGKPAVWWKHAHKCHVYYTPKSSREGEEPGNVQAQ